MRLVFINTVFHHCCYESINQSNFRAVWILFTDAVDALLTESHKDAASLIPRLASFPGWAHSQAGLIPGWPHSQALFQNGGRKELGNEVRMLQPTLIQYIACVSDEDVGNDYNMYT